MAQAGKKEEEIYTLRYLQQLYQNQYTSIVNEMNRSMEYLNELNIAQKTIESTGELNGKGALIGLGAGMYITSSVKKINSILVGIGGGYVVEKSIDEAKQFTVARIERVTALFNRLVKSRNEVRNAAMDVSYRLDALSGK
ncbi:MAG TPA: prefoldin subunit alpha [Candidatus Acidoferrum sp.]|nr:prefoldin subunit alpha [Candidatus Acidoferrum sp.]